MWMVLIPFGWYFIEYVNSDFEYSVYSSLLLSAFIALGLFFNNAFRVFIWNKFTFFYELLNTFEKYRYARTIKKLQKKKYVYIKTDKIKS